MCIRIQVFDPPMCCSTGVCGPSVDPQLVQFAADLDWLTSRGVSVERFNLSQQPGAFANDPVVKSALETKGDGALPLLKVDGIVKSTGSYPSREELAAWTGLEVDSSIFTEAVAELVAIGASIASNCEQCFRFHFDRARKLGVSKEDMLLAVEKAQAVKDTMDRNTLELAAKYLLPGKSQGSAGCCGGEAGSTGQRGCC